MLASDLRYSLIASAGTPSPQPIPCRRAVTLIGSRKGCKIVLEHNPEHTDARFGLARIYSAQGKGELAKVELEKLLSIDPLDNSARELLRQLQ